MKRNTKSSITLPPNELELVEKLQKNLGAKSKVEVIRRGLRLLEETTERAHLRKAYQEASQRARKSSEDELVLWKAAEFDGLED